jgi:hypothetical protein
VFKWPSGSWFEGHFKDDYRHGYGIMHWIDGTKYEGTWVRGLQEGKGQLALNDGTLKVGLFKENLIVEELYSEVSPFAVKILGSSDSSKKLTQLHETLLEAEYDTLVKTHYKRKI